ncbi:hypothetical protein AVEN_215870-1 [Araneus ventricosus]|uniref:Uncharacterized protein n=1 Tax=Araneus ventricosus TaxID=182803 RepID=A0A4Y2MXG0_ARAVE|nr:hypothetical protein AVEN_215870-1 [Araneus ventricosus]
MDAVANPGFGSGRWGGRLRYKKFCIVVTNVKSYGLCKPKHCFIWYQQKRSSEQEELIRIVKTAASIILEDIRSQEYEAQEYPPSDSFLQESDSLIPEIHRALTETIILNKNRGDVEKWRGKCTAIANGIISAASPKFFISGMLVGLAAFLYKM